MRRIAIVGVLIILVAAIAGWFLRPEFREAVLALIENKKDWIDPSKGKWKGDLEVRFFSGTSGDGHPIELILLLKPFGYTDSRGVEWNVPEGYISDGASIPEWLWAALGGPYSGRYRDAAVIHDFHCREKTRKWQDVHMVFLEAALNRGTAESLAKSMYAGILFGGPRWDGPSVGVNASRLMKAQILPTQSTKPPPTGADKTDKEIFEDLKAWIEREKPTLEQIRKKVEEIRKAQKKK
jgi:hypothetical protein